MTKKRSLLILGLSASLLAPTVLATVAQVSHYQVPIVEAVQEQQAAKLSLGATLNGQQEASTRQLLGAGNVAANNTIRVDGTMVNRYLNDGSTAATDVYSSAYIEPQASNYGVQVQVVTPENITQVSSLTYQNAAITAGAKNVLVRVATVIPVTGEGALAGVYALLDESGHKVDPGRVKVANDEIRVINEINQYNYINNYQINQFISYLKIEINNYIRQNNDHSITINNIEQIINNIVTNNSHVFQGLTDAEIQQIKDLLKDYGAQYAETEAAQDPEIADQLQVSIIGSNWPATLEGQEGTLSVKEALKVEAPDFSSEAYHPVVGAIYQELKQALEAGDTSQLYNMYSHTFVVELMQPTLSQQSRDGLNFVRALIYQVLAHEAEANGLEAGVFKEYLIANLNRAATLKQDPALYSLISQIAIKTGYAPEAYAYTNWQDQEGQFTVDIERINSAQPTAYGSFTLDKASGQVVNSQGKTYDQPVNFQGAYGVAVEDQSTLAPVPETYSAPSEEDALEKPDNVIDLEEELPGMEAVTPDSSTSQASASEEIAPDEASAESEAESLASETAAPAVSEVAVPSSRPSYFSGDRYNEFIQLIAGWAEGQEADLQEVQPGVNQDFNGVAIPNQAFSQAIIDGQAKPVQWATETQDAGVVNVVAVFTAQGQDQQAIYLFALEDGQGQIYVNTDGADSQGQVNYHSVEDADLLTGFQAIMANESTLGPVAEDQDPAPVESSQAEEVSQAPEASESQVSQEDTESLASQPQSEASQEVVEEALEESADPNQVSSTDQAESEAEAETVDLPDFKQSWASLIQSLDPQAPLSLQALEDYELLESTPVADAFYEELQVVMDQQASAMDLLSHTFVYEDLASVTPQDQAALNQVRWLAVHYELNQGHTSLIDDLIFNQQATDQLSQDPTASQVYDRISQETGYSMAVYPASHELVHDSEADKFYYAFTFQTDQGPKTFAYDFDSDQVGELNGLDFQPLTRSFDWQASYGLSVDSPSYAAIPLPAQAQALRDQAQASLEESAQSAETMVESEVLDPNEAIIEDLPSEGLEEFDSLPVEDAELVEFQ
ncbi:DUF1002 domain-containing protein [Hutsoniella sourekii]